MQKNIAYISIGSNSIDSLAMADRARKAIHALDGVSLLACSPVFLTEPQDYGNQPWFINQVVKVELQEKWSPVIFLAELLEIEKSMGRERGGGAPRFGPRNIDLDLLLFGDQKLEMPDCIIPHPRAHLRAFVLVPLLTIEPDLRINGMALREHLARLDWRLDGARIYQTQSLE